ncbi:hypothetical protein [Streptomyces flaveus]|uniref:Uncharacterized protein n=1 Tax=Streptomyces flaveus TaxID=66370 RepID=A0A917RF24_9ACTN|nr:hypothetical protein [Streptomyces flaveus]GGL03013.1 hypothetical protein GCM10010094_74700 [Streptomyces flaveus]
MGLRSSLVDAVLARAIQQEDKHDYRRALRNYRWIVKHGRGNGLDVRVAATGGVYRVLREVHRHAPATTETDLDAARTTAAQSLLARARMSRGHGRLAEAQRDFRAAIDQRVWKLSGEAAHELAEMIDDARGNPRDDRYPTTPYDQDQPRRIRPRTVGPDPRENLRALGHATESDALAAAITLCRTALQHPKGLFDRRGISALLVQLLDDYGDAAGAAAARAHQELPLKLDAALSEVEPNYTYYRPQEFAPFLIARLRPTEIVEHLQASTLQLPQPPESLWGGYLILTGERLLFLEDFFYPRQGDPDRPNPKYEMLAVERTSVTGSTFSQNRYGNALWHFRFPPTADGEAAHQGELRVDVGRHVDLWRAAFPR